jgi:soluble lytic murein transglycosylase-like protein
VQINDDGSRQGPALNGKPVIIPAPEAMRDQYGDNPVYQSIIKQAQKFGVPVGVALRLGYVESKFQDTPKNSSGAEGPLQVTGKNHDARAMKMFGKKVSELTNDENIAVGLSFLKERFEEHGDWTEAANDYIGRGDNDGNIKSRTYAELIGRE